MTPKEKIIEAAMEAFRVKGIKAVTMDSIAQTAGVSKRTIYELFSDKDNLVVETFGHMIIEHNKELKEIFGSTSNVIESMFMIMEKESERRKDISPMLKDDLHKYYPLINAAYFNTPKQMREYSATYIFLQKGMEQGIIRKELKVELVDTFLHEMVSMVHTSERLKLLDPDKQEYLDNIFMPYIKGICTRKGHTLMEKYFENLTEQ